MDGKQYVRKQHFEIPFDQHVLQCDSYQRGCNTIVLHGAGQSSRHRFARLRQALAIKGIPSVSFDFVGHGETGGSLSGSSLRERTDQASAVIRHACSEPLNLVGASMSGHTAIKLTEKFRVANLILLVPAVYTPGPTTFPSAPRFQPPYDHPVAGKTQTPSLFWRPSRATCWSSPPSPMRSYPPRLSTRFMPRLRTPQPVVFTWCPDRGIYPSFPVSRRFLRCWV